jgi:acyl dehydratase
VRRRRRDRPLRFSDFHAGQTLEAGPAALTADEIVAFAQRYDPQWFHTDAQRAAASRWQGLIASGWHTCAVAMRLAVDHFLAGSESFGSPGLEYLKWLAPVRPGDALSLRAEVLEQRRSERQPTLGILRWRWTLVNQRGEAVLDLVATSLFELQDSGANGAREVGKPV